MVKKVTKKEKKPKKEEKVEEEGGVSLDDAFGDDSDVEYAPTKPKKEKKKKKGMSEEELEEELDEVEEEAEEIGEKVSGEAEVGEREITFKTSKPISKVKKGDKVKIDGIEYEVDEHYVLIDHKTTKEMAIELFNPKTDKDYQLRYFDDQAESTLDFYELAEILYIKRPFKKIEW